jgi:hypothetical protein
MLEHLRPALLLLSHLVISLVICERLTRLGDATRVAGVKNGDTMGGNGCENEQTRSVAVKLSLSKLQSAALHKEISSRGLGYQEVLDRAKDMFNKW